MSKIYMKDCRHSKSIGKIIEGKIIAKTYEEIGEEDEQGNLVYDNVYSVRGLNGVLYGINERDIERIEE